MKNLKEQQKKKHSVQSHLIYKLSNFFIFARMHRNFVTNVRTFLRILFHDFFVFWGRQQLALQDKKLREHL